MRNDHPLDERLSCLELLLPVGTELSSALRRASWRSASGGGGPDGEMALVLGRPVRSPPGWSPVSRYLVVPNEPNPRFLLPTGPRAVLRSSIGLFRPSRRKGRIARQLLELSARVGVLGYVPSSSVTLLKRAGSPKPKALLETFLRQWLGRGSHYCAFSTGTPGPFRKISIRVMDSAGRCVAFAKAGRAGKPADRVRIEADLLKTVSGLGIRTVRIPELIGRGRVGDWEILLEGHVEGGSARAVATSARQLAAFSGELHSLTSSPGSVESGPFWDVLSNRVGELGDSTARHSTAVKVLLSRALEQVRDRLGGQTMPMGLSHGDLASWNLITHGDDRTVIDWEMAREGTPPLIDLFHSLVFEPLLLKSMSPEAAVSRLERQPVVGILTSLLDDLGCRDLSILVLSALYLTDRLAILLEEQGLSYSDARASQVTRLMTALDIAIARM